MSVKNYIRGHINSIGVLVGMCVIFAVTFMAYKLPVGAVVYPALLSTVLMITLFTLGYFKEKKRHDMVQDAMLRRELINETMLPPALTIVEDDYRELVRVLQQERVSALTAVNMKYDRLSEYYTLWAHQIKTPIASMRLKLSGMDSEAVRAVSSDLLRIEQYVDMVMTYVRLDSDSTDYQFRMTSLDEVIKSNLRKFSTDFISKKLSLEYEPTDIEVLTDGKWLGFVLEQLLSNSVKYTQKGHISVKVTPNNQKQEVISTVGSDNAAGSSVSHNTVSIQIADTGMGISSENLPRIFELGFTGYNGRTDNRASGIGMYLCKRVCDNLGTDIKVESVVGEGTTVTLTIKDRDEELYYND